MSASPYRTQVQPAASFLVCSLIFIEYKEEIMYHIKEAAKLLQAIRTYGFDCSIEVFGHIGKGYVYNPEFKENIDKFGPGTAQYTSDVIAHYVQTQTK